MRLHFRPFLGLTIATVIGLVILIALGTWQYQRLQWKTALLAEIEQVADAPPFTSLAQVQTALDAGEPIDFRRYGSNAEMIAAKPIFVFTPQSRDISWRLFAPVEQGGITVFAALGVVPDKMKNKVEARPFGDGAIIGYVRQARPVSRGETKSSPDKNRWFGFNPLPKTHNWADQLRRNPDMRFYIDTVPGALNVDDLPARRPEIRNNHFDYMLTWYGLALVLLVIYLIMHRRAGRLGLS